MVAGSLQPLLTARMYAPVRQLALAPIMQSGSLLVDQVVKPWAPPAATPRSGLTALDPQKVTARCYAGLTALDPQQATFLGAASNVFLSLLKLAVGLLTGSASLIADAGHSCSDLIVDAVCLLAVKAPVFERVCLAAIASVLGSAGVACVWTSVAAITAAGSAPPVGAMPMWALVVALICCGAKELLFRITAVVGKTHGSAVLTAAAKHHRSDALSSVAAAVGSCGVLLGFPVADALAAALVGLIIVKMSVGIALGHA